MIERKRLGGLSADYQLMFLGDVDSTPGGASLLDGEGFVWNEEQEKFVHTQLMSGLGLGLINVRDYGAVGDGVTDDTASVQAALDAIQDTADGTGARTVVFPTGRYAISSVTLPRWGRCVIDGCDSQILPIGNPAYVFKIPGDDPAYANHYTTLKNFECWGSCTDFVQLLGVAYNFRIENIVHREGVLDSVVRLWNTSTVSAPGLWQLRRIISAPWDTVNHHATYAIKFFVDGPGHQGWDTGIIEDVSISSSVTGACAIFVTVGQNVYLRYASINKVFLGLYETADITGYALYGWFLDSQISNIYIETVNDATAITGYLTRCDISRSGCYSLDAGATLKAVDAILVDCDIRQVYALRAGSATPPYESGTYYIVTPAEGSARNRFYFPKEYVKNAILLYNQDYIEAFGALLPSDGRIDLLMGQAPNAGGASFGRVKAIYNGDLANGTAAWIDFVRPVANFGNEAEIRFATNPGSSPTAGTTPTQRMVVNKDGSVLIGTETDGLTGDGSLAVAKDFAHRGANLGFYNTAPIAKQTGVAVSAAGIHAALVALGLISA